MSKTIKIIDLLNKIANGEEFPKKVKFEDKIYTYYNEMTDYKNEGYFLFDMISDGYVKDFLNDKVEIIEEQEEIDIQEINLDFARLSQFSIKNSKGQEEILEVLFVEIQEKMKELARKINYLDKNIKEKQ